MFQEEGNIKLEFTSCNPHICLTQHTLHRAELVDRQPTLGNEVLTVTVEHVHRVIDRLDLRHLTIER